jgi:hypothetical protein
MLATDDNKVSIEQVFDSKIVPSISEVIKSNNSDEVIKEATWVLVILSSTNNEEYICRLRDSDIVSSFIGLIHSSNLEIIEHVSLRGEE